MYRLSRLKNKKTPQSNLMRMLYFKRFSVVFSKKMIPIMFMCTNITKKKMKFD